MFSLTMSVAPDPLTPSLVLWFPPELVVELALGADHPHEIAQRYDVPVEDYEQLAAQPWFEEMVARKRVEFHDNGLLFQAKAAMMAEALLTRLFQSSMGGKLAPPMMIEVSKQLVDIGRLKPQPGLLPAASGPGFQINIQINDAHRTPVATSPSAHTSGQVIDLVPEVKVDFDPVPAPLRTPPPYISNLKMPNFDGDLRPRPPAPSALTGTPQAQAAAAAPSSPPGAAVGLPSKPSVR